MKILLLLIGLGALQSAKAGIPSAAYYPDTDVLTADIVSCPKCSPEDGRLLDFFESSEYYGFNLTEHPKANFSKVPLLGPELVNSPDLSNKLLYRTIPQEDSFISALPPQYLIDRYVVVDSSLRPEIIDVMKRGFDGMKRPGKAVGFKFPNIKKPGEFIPVEVDPHTRAIPALEVKGLDVRSAVAFASRKVCAQQQNMYVRYLTAILLSEKADAMTSSDWNKVLTLVCK